MAHTRNEAVVSGRCEVQETYVLKHRRFLFFPVSYWEKVKTEGIRNEIIIQTDHDIRAIIFNGREIIL